ncbi:MULTISPECIES: response regulator transcription factor [unclassified Polaromonas]|uniref:response regulator transcription factor n=1 Tax=unclassified Polaromonas TaxID=2638319 RepID=UPI000F08CD78|nr:MULTISPECIES: response regulator transcription factor [unclassified Polaromonas]AYQ29956.1 DNA-binding response regulator [Polaromonas sp. SP1]QGJ18927.1 response regulator [Polaromonas sp. Pch-P]
MKALLVEDDGPMRSLLCGALAAWGFTTTSAVDGAQALASWQLLQPDALILDLGLPDMDGLDVLQRGRALGLQTPVMLLSARATLSDRILGLNFGADDYLTKPFDLGELEARLRALCRRKGASPPLPPQDPDLAQSLGTLNWRPSSGAFFCGDKRLSLSPRELALLRALVERPNRAQPKEYLVNAVFPERDVLEDAVEVVAHRLRKKLLPCGVAVVTLRGLGYLIKSAG